MASKQQEELCNTEYIKQEQNRNIGPREKKTRLLIKY
jgi:hypothetical protein